MLSLFFLHNIDPFNKEKSLTAYWSRNIYFHLGALLLLLHMCSNQHPEFCTCDFVFNHFLIPAHSNPKSARGGKSRSWKRGYVIVQLRSILALFSGVTSNNFPPTDLFGTLFRTPERTRTGVSRKPPSVSLTVGCVDVSGGAHSYFDPC